MIRRENTNTIIHICEMIIKIKILGNNLKLRL